MPHKRYTIGRLASQCGYRLHNEVLQSARGFYIGTSNEQGPVSRESVEYYKSEAAALIALENNGFTQRLCA